MPGFDENQGQKLTSMLAKNADEMSQQTLDALRIVQSFESKPARSTHIKQILSHREHEQVKLSQMQKIAGPQRPHSSPEHHHAVLEPFTLGSPEPTANRPSFSRTNSATEPSSRPLNSSSHEQVRLPTIEELRKHSRSTVRAPSAGSTSSIRQTRLNQATPAHLAATRAKNFSTTTSIFSRLLKPTAASTAKIARPALTNQSIAKAAARVAAPRPTARPVLTPVVKTNGSEARPASSRPVSGGLKAGGIMKQPTKSTQSRLTNLRPASSSRSHQEASRAPSHAASAVTPFKTAPIPPTISLPPPVEQASPSLSFQNGTSVGAGTAMVMAAAQTTSTPVRALQALGNESEHSHTMPSIDFSNFSYVADWATTPELAKRSLDQHQREGALLKQFDTIPAVDLELTFGAERRKQRRK